MRGKEGRQGGKKEKGVIERRVQRGEEEEGKGEKGEIKC